MERRNQRNHPRAPGFLGGCGRNYLPPPPVGRSLLLRKWMEAFGSEVSPVLLQCWPCPTSTLPWIHVHLIYEEGKSQGELAQEWHFLEDLSVRVLRVGYVTLNPQRILHLDFNCISEWAYSYSCQDHGRIGEKTRFITGPETCAQFWKNSLHNPHFINLVIILDIAHFFFLK